MLLITVAGRWHRPLSWDFINSYPSRFAEQAGIKAALYGTLWLMALTALFAVPIGIGAAIYLEEFAPRNWFTQIIETNINNLAGVPSIIYGLLGLAIFVRVAGPGPERPRRRADDGAADPADHHRRVARRPALRAAVDPRGGARRSARRRWQTVRFQVLPAAMPAMLTGVILALSRAIGETAPLIMIGALTLRRRSRQTARFDRFTVLPIQIFNWTSRPQARVRQDRRGGIIVLLVVLLTMNAFAIVLRNYFERKRRW